MHVQGVVPARRVAVQHVLAGRGHDDRLAGPATTVGFESMDLDPDTITAAELGGYMTGVRQREAS